MYVSNPNYSYYKDVHKAGPTTVTNVIKYFNFCSFPVFFILNTYGFIVVRAIKIIMFNIVVWVIVVVFLYPLQLNILLKSKKYFYGRRIIHNKHSESHCTYVSYVRKFFFNFQQNPSVQNKLLLLWCFS